MALSEDGSCRGFSFSDRPQVCSAQRRLRNIATSPSLTATPSCFFLPYSLSRTSISLTSIPDLSHYRPSSTAITTTDQSYHALCNFQRQQISCADVLFLTPCHVRSDEVL
ncbi:hypothetical protein E2C01_019461 [Portunus trituberculatus]|uniref:Uncharacterized protein n=1 Tax=Portunus trituberculatus TaxID=210409 RepID=A0A5B7DZ16_PORTR|nr:hypothetical protein [Portunus trituberculatus]